MIINIWNKITNIGLSDSVEYPDAKRIKLTNQLALVAFIFTFCYVFIFTYWNIRQIIPLQLFPLAAYSSVILLSHFKKFQLAKCAFSIILYIHIFFLCICFGKESQVHLLFIPITAVPLALFDIKQKQTIILLIVLGLAVFSLLYVYDFASMQLIPIPNGLLPAMRFSFNLTAVLSEVVIFLVFIRNFERSERELDQNNELLQEQLKAIFENSFDALFLVDWTKRKIIKANQRAVELFQMDSEKEFFEKWGPELHKKAPPESELIMMKNAIINHGFYEGEVLYKTKAGKEFWGSLAIKLVLIGDKKYQSVRISDITIEKKAKAHIESSLQVKELLLSEIHHRVKNNMAVISGLLGLQSTYVEDEHSRQLFEESRMRIHSMALIHDKLYHHETFARIDFDAYCNDLINYIKSSYNASQSPVNFSVNCKDVFIDIKNAVPCGLILNELLTNSYKHAFKGKPEGEIKIVCTKMGGKFTMMVSDNGVGFDAEKIIDKPVSLGITLINALANQVNGTLKVVNKNGTTYYLSFEE
jgi:PAS domain S-box-containing protein